MLVSLVLTGSGVWSEETGLRIKDLRYGVHEERVRLIFDVTEEPAVRFFHLTAPDRLVLDMPKAGWDVPDERSASLPYVRAMRHGLFRPGQSRLVFDLDRPLRVEQLYTEAARDGLDARLSVDLSPSERASFDATAGWPDGARWVGTAARASRESQDVVVMIDPGHGGVDPGANADGMVEKTVVLDFARELAAQIDAMPGFRAALTRDRDIFLPLAERVALAHRAGAHVMISVHADVLEEGRANGMAVYTLSEEATDRAATNLAERENRADVLAGADLGGESDQLARLLIELAQRGTHPESERLAGVLLDALGKDYKLLRTRPHRRANFRVLQAPDIPSVLLELGFMNSAVDRGRLASPDWRAGVATRVVAGLRAWHEERR